MAADKKNIPLYQQGNATARNWRDYVASAKGTAMESVYASALNRKFDGKSTLIQAADANNARLAELNKTLTPFDKQYFDKLSIAEASRKSITDARMSDVTTTRTADGNRLMGLNTQRANNPYQLQVNQSQQRINQLNSNLSNAQSSLAYAQSQNDSWGIQRAQSDILQAQQNISFESSVLNSAMQSANFYNSNIDTQISAVNSRIGVSDQQLAALKSLNGKTYSANDIKVLQSAGVSESAYSPLIDANLGMQVFQDQAVAARKASGSQIQGALSLSQFSNLSSEYASTSSTGTTLDTQIADAVVDAETGYQQDLKSGRVRAAQTRNTKHLPLTGVFGNPDHGVGLQIPGAMP